MVLETLGLQSILVTKHRFKSDDVLTAFGAIDFGNTSFNHAVQIREYICSFVRSFVHLFYFILFYDDGT